MSVPGTRLVVACAWAAPCLAGCQAAPPAAAQTGARPPAALTDSSTVAAVVDSVMRAGMAAERIPGGAVVLVRAGRVAFSKGYGVSDAASGRPVSPDSTIWRIGSITKVFTAVAALQLVDRGQVDLHADVNRYLRRLQVPTTYPEPVTLAHLLTHTAGFDELPGVRLARSREEMMPLADFLRGRLVRVRPPGHVTSYSSFGAALAGALVEEVSGLAYEAYLVRHVFRPLGMRRAHVTPSAEEAAALATGYDVQGGAPRPAAYEWYHTTPAGAINATATDMARFMSMLLGHQREGVRVLSEQSRRAMLRRQATMHGAIPGWGYGLQEHEINGQRIFEHGGDIAGFSALMVLLPEHDVGLFVATHREGSQLRFQLEQALLDRLFPDRRAPPARPPRGTRASVEPFVGTYRWNIYCRTCAVPSQQPTWTVAANDDGTITVAGKRWILTGPLLFRSEDGKSQLGFATDSTGRVMHLTSGAWRVMERVR